MKNKSKIRAVFWLHTTPLYQKGEFYTSVRDNMINIDACRKGDREALGELYTAYSPKLLRICRHYVKDESIAEDIIHDAFAIIFVAIRNLKDDARLEGWMITIVRNLSLRYLQSRDKAEIPLSALDIDFPEETAQQRPGIDLDQLLAAIESLPAGNREVFKLAVLDGLSHQEIGDLLGIAPHSSSSQLSRAKKMLRTMIGRSWPLLLLPLLIPVYIYVMNKDRSARLAEQRPSVQKTRKAQLRKRQKGAPETARRTTTGTGKPDNPYRQQQRLAITAGPPAEGSRYEMPSPVTAEQLPTTLKADSLMRRWTSDSSRRDTLWRLPAIPHERMMAWNGGTNRHASRKKHYPWTFNFGYSSNAGAAGALSNLDYLSVVDYANGGVRAKIHTIAEFTDYLDRNASLMDSVEQAKLREIVNGSDITSSVGLKERKHHFRPITFGLAISKQLGPRWTFGTGLTYTRLKSELVSDFANNTLKQTQKIDYVGLPLRLTYHIWNKGSLNAYTTGGLNFEWPVRSRLDKEYIVTADSAFTIKGNLKARCQWSVNWGVGIQYKLFKPFSLYIEPSLYYYFGNGSGIETYRTEHPFTITVPFGLRITW